VLNARTERYDTPCSLVDTGYFLTKIGYVAFTKMAAKPRATFAKSREPALFGRSVLGRDGMLRSIEQIIGCGGGIKREATAMPKQRQ
jgi:hypothetical protein